MAEFTPAGCVLMRFLHGLQVEDAMFCCFSLSARKQQKDAAIQGC